MALRHLAAALSAVILAALNTSPAAAAELGRPAGPVVLTIAGEIGQTNRPPFDPAADLFLKYHERTFEKAAAFDYAMLEALGLQEIEVSIPEWPAPLHLAGPRLTDLLTAVGVTGKDVTFLALDGYASEISWADVTALDWIVGIKRDGAYLGLGQQGPVWVVYRYRDGRPLTLADEQRWPWAAFYIQID